MGADDAHTYTLYIDLPLIPDCAVTQRLKHLKDYRPYMKPLLRPSVL